MKQQQQSAPPPDRGARILQLAIQIMAQGARGWSDALKQASERVK